MASFVEQATLMVRDAGATATINKINAALLKLQAIAKALKSTTVSLNIKDPALAKAVGDVKRLESELARLRSASAAINVRVNTAGAQAQISRLRTQAPVTLRTVLAGLADKIKRYVAELTAIARPVIQGIGDGQALRVLYPLSEDANRITLTGFSHRDGNRLLLLALLEPERLSERLLQIAVDGSISSTERNERQHALQQELTQLRYDEEAAISAAIGNGDDNVSRLGSSPAWAVLMVQIEHEQQVAA